MRTKDFDPNKEFAYREKTCKDGVKFLESYLPIKRPPFFKRRVAELYASYKCYPVSIRKIPCFPELGECIVFIPFTRFLLGRYKYSTGKREEEIFRQAIYEKAPQKRK